MARAEEIIKNTYRTLMTRGMKGCYVYCTDKALSDYIERRLHHKVIKYPTVGESLGLKAAESVAVYGKNAHKS